MLAQTEIIVSRKNFNRMSAVGPPTQPTSSVNAFGGLGSGTFTIWLISSHMRSLSWAYPSPSNPQRWHARELARGSELSTECLQCWDLRISIELQRLPTRTPLAKHEEPPFQRRHCRDQGFVAFIERAGGSAHPQVGGCACANEEAQPLAAQRHDLPEVEHVGVGIVYGDHDIAPQLKPRSLLYRKTGRIQKECAARPRSEACARGWRQCSIS